MVVERFDAIVVGAGHNGLVAAAYLARAGRRVLVLERRDVTGGAAVTEDLAPGFRVSTASYSLSLLRPDVHAELDLARHGLVITPKDPQMFVPLPDGRHYFVWRDGDRTREEIARINPADADALGRWGAFWTEAVAKIRPLVEAPDPPGLDGVRAALGEELYRMAVAGSCADTVRAFFDAPEIQGPMAGQGIIGTKLGPEEEGTAWIMTFHAIGGELNGMDGTWAYVRGGMGGVTQAIAAAAREAGAEIRVSSPVSRIVTGGGRVRGVTLADGTMIEAPLVLSNATPAVTFGTLLDDGVLPPSFAERVASWQYEGAVVKVNLALRELPSFSMLPGTEPAPQHLGTVEIAHSIEYIQQAREDARGAMPSSKPFMEVFLQSSGDRTLVPGGEGHVLSAFTQYAPEQPVDWDAARRAARDNAVAALAAYAPNLPDAIVTEDVLAPPDLEERLALTGGDIFHGALSPEQSFGERFDYRTPVEGLYLCGSGARPGGGVMGAAGRNAARVALG
ncbi:MAG TPA: NAD(P)/FAD-dependent oxidoreductase [Actinomycetota bacterium]|nr:NAD(P)/FAD-dependent oxidoreductase [Actinomycetota bacterium]